MSLVSDVFYNKKLKDKKVNIVTSYIVDNTIVKRDTNDDGSVDINKGIICTKHYYANGELKHTENVFDSRIEYSFIASGHSSSKHKCINCGYSDTLDKFRDGCPYCRTNYNIDYQDKDLGSKYHYDLVLKSNKYRIITGIIDFIISEIISFIFIYLTSRTFASYDIFKAFLYGLILAMVLYYFFYLMDAYIILNPIKEYKEKQNNKQKDFWESTKYDKKRFFNNLNYEIRKYYYGIDNIIDYDILDYESFKRELIEGIEYVNVLVNVRLVFFTNNKIYSKYEKVNYRMKRVNNESLELGNKTNMIKCPNCGSSVDITKGKCEYCRHEFDYFQEWVIDI